MSEIRLRLPRAHTAGPRDASARRRHPGDAGGSAAHSPVPVAPRRLLGGRVDHPRQLLERRRGANRVRDVPVSREARAHQPRKLWTKADKRECRLRVPAEVASRGRDARSDPRICRADDGVPLSAERGEAGVGDVGERDSEGVGAYSRAHLHTPSPRRHGTRTAYDG